MRAALLTFALLFSTAASAVEFAHYDPVRHQFALEGKVHYYVEEYNEQQPHEALDLLQKGHFTRSESPRLSLGYTSKAVWVAVPVAQIAGKSDRLILEITALIDSIQFNYLNERGLRLESFVTGRDMPLSSRPLEHHNFIFPVMLERASRGFILMRLMSQGSMLVPLKLMPESEFYQLDRLELLVFGIYFGLMAVMVLYNLFLYAATRERSYAFYVFYILFFMLFQFAIWGFFHELVLPESPQLAKFGLPLFLHLATIFQLLFAAQFFQARDIIPRLYKISGYLSFVTFVSLLSGGFVPYRWFITLGILTGSSAALLIFFQALILYVKRRKVARFFLIAYTTLIGGVVFLALRNMGIINYSFISSYSAQIGSALEVILLSLALADRINIWRDEKDKAQKQVIDREREMNRAFQLFVPQKFLELAGETDFTKLELGKSSTREITILFSDIRRFTSLSETMTPEQNFKFLNSYLSRMGPIIRQHGGFIDKFIGDAIMALFAEGHGGPRADAAKDGILAASANAARAALAMRHELKAYNAHRAAQGYQPIDIGIGIHTGMVRLGTIGENERWEGTVIGDTVNLASRIENLSSTFNAPIVVSEAVLKTLPADQPCRELDTIRVKGKQKAVKVFELLPDED
ncbi:MAG: 7TM diverse intracellular signaling domain-containing protein [Turneriella sp.]